MRKRLSRRSPGPELRKSRNIQPPSAVTGPDTVNYFWVSLKKSNLTLNLNLQIFVAWTSQLFMWLYSDLVIVNELIHGWLMTVNDVIRSTLADQSVVIEIIRMLPESPPPTITNIYCDKLDGHNPNDLVGILE
jgi:hypothetical protein